MATTAACCRAISMSCTGTSISTQLPPSVSTMYLRGGAGRWASARKGRRTQRGRPARCSAQAPGGSARAPHLLGMPSSSRRAALPRLVSLVMSVNWKRLPVELSVALVFHSASSCSVSGSGVGELGQEASRPGWLAPLLAPSAASCAGRGRAAPAAALSRCCRPQMLLMVLLLLLLLLLPGPPARPVPHPPAQPTW